MTRAVVPGTTPNPPKATGRPNADERTLMRLLALALLISAAIWASRIPLDAREAHREADSVLWPNFVSVSNEWAIHHGATDPGHLDTVNTKDRQRFEATVKAFNEWRDAMKQAGY